MILLVHEDGETKEFASHEDAALFLAGHDGRGSRFGRDQNGEMILFFTTHHGKEQVAFRGKGGHVENDAEAVEMLAQEACTHEWGHWGCYGALAEDQIFLEDHSDHVTVVVGEDRFELSCDDLTDWPDDVPPALWSRIVHAGAENRLCKDMFKIILNSAN
jgi:hypothetical protein